MTNKKTGLEQILKMTKQLHKLASTEKWEEVDKLVKARQSCIEACFANDTSIKDIPAATKCIEEVQQLDKEIVELGVKAKRKIGAELNKIQQGRVAIDAYQAAK